MNPVLRIALSGGMILAACLLVGGVSAQSTTGTLSGSLRTDDGFPVEGAVVQARSEATGAARTAVTNAKGRYRIESVAPGDWTVAARLDDGRVSESRVVHIELQQTVELDFTVGGGLTEKVTVTAEAPLVDRKKTVGSLRITADQLDQIPTSGRTFTDLALLDSAVQTAAPGVLYGEREAAFSLNGQSARSNSFLVDGLDNNDQTSGTNLNSFYSQQVIREFVLLMHQYAPEFGRASGGVLNIVTHQGTNDPSWGVFAQGVVGPLSESADFVDSLPGGDRSLAQRFQGGFRFGGPFRKDRAFYFLAYERHELNKLHPYVGVTRDQVGDFGEPSGGVLNTASTNDSLFLRTDFNLSKAHSLMLRVSANAREDGGINVEGVTTPEAGFRFEEQDVGLAGSLTSVVSSSLINEVRFQAATSSFDQFANSDRSGVARPSGIFGGNNLNRQLRDEDRFQLVDNVTLQNKSHTMKFGLDVVHSRTRIETKFNPNGNFIYNTDLAHDPGDCGNLFFFLIFQAEGDPDDPDDGTWPVVPCPGVRGEDDDLDGFVDEPGIITSYPVVYQYIFGEPEALIEDTQIALFAQDHWDVNRKLVLDYGLRYDLSTYTLPEELRVDSTIPNGGAGRDYNNVSPRFGFTFDPKANGKLLFRGGAGKFYDKLVLGFFGVSAITSGTEIGLTFPQGLTDELNEQQIEDLGIDRVLSRLQFPEALIMRFSTGTELETPYTLQWNLGVEYGLGVQSALGANYVNSRGYNLPLMVDLNPVVDYLPPVDLPIHRDETNGSIASIVSEGRSWYQALELNYRYRAPSGWFSASYTYSKAEDMGFDPLKGGISLPPDSDDLEAERGRADGDRRHRMVLSADTGLPWLGLRISGVLQASSGMAYNVTTGTDDNLDGILSDRPEGVGRNTGKKTPLGPINAIRRQINSDYAKIVAGHPGLADKADELMLDEITNLTEPTFAQIDLRLYRPFEFSEKGQGEVFFQVFNLLDRENVGLIEGRVSSANYGRAITLAGPPRTVELGVRFAF